jgi:hypothetical protein
MSTNPLFTVLVFWFSIGHHDMVCQEHPSPKPPSPEASPPELLYWHQDTCTDHHTVGTNTHQDRSHLDPAARRGDSLWMRTLRGWVRLNPLLLNPFTVLTGHSQLAGLQGCRHPSTPKCPAQRHHRVGCHYQRLGLHLGSERVSLG